MVKEVIDEREGEYLCVMEDNEDVEWHKLSPTHPLIAEFRKQRALLLQDSHDGPVELFNTELNNFMSSLWGDV